MHPPRLANSPSSPRIDVLDGLRGLAIALVVVYHLHEYIPKLWGATAFGETGRLNHAMGFLWIGVDLFYVLSGFFIASAVLRPAQWDGAHFLKNRLTRILPAYYASIVVVVLLGAPNMLTSLIGWVDILLHVTFLHHLQEWSMFSINGPYWTLGVEFSFYVLMLALGPVLRLPRGWLVMVLFIGISLLWKVNVWVAVPPPQRFFWGVQLPAALEEFAFGMAVAFAVQRGWLQRGSLGHRHGIALALLVTGVVAVGACMVHFVRLKTDYWLHGPTLIMSRTVLSAGFAAMLASFVVWGAWRPLVTLVRLSGLQLLGRLSFSLYLLHIPVLLLVHRMAGKWVGPGWLLIALMVSCMLAAAWASHRWIEQRWHPSA